MYRNVPPRTAFTAMPTHRTDIEPARPEGAPPQGLLQARHPGEQLTRRDALDRADDLGRAVGRNRLDQKMDMVLIGPDLQELDLVALRNALADRDQSRVHTNAAYTGGVSSARR